ncbi:hypothetical protein BMS3Abin10_00917 [bacterium BMS3Abin10]|nr:hypothetical protein BMS3Abin10_00917 [bacterium BMS3Abin10]GBE39663.1 hypothetical protein BMS3Bbin08_02294 [bacterium BMS3Bbin08]
MYNYELRTKTPPLARLARHVGKTELAYSSFKLITAIFCLLFSTCLFANSVFAESIDDIRVIGIGLTIDPEQCYFD